MKNLKMFAIAVMAFAVMAMGVRAVGTCNDTNEASIGEACYSTLATAVTAAEKGDTIKILKNVSSAAAITVTDTIKDLTIDLNGHNIVFTTAAGITVNDDAKLTLTGKGEVKTAASASTPLITVDAGANLVVSGNVKLNTTATSAANPAIMVKSNSDSDVSTSVEVGANASVTSTGYGLVIGDATNTAALNTSVKLDGTWNTAVYAVKVNGLIAYAEENAPKVDIVGGSFTSTGNVALYASGYAIWNVNAKSVKGTQAMEVRSGDVTIAGGAFENTDDTKAGGSAADYNAVLSIVGNDSGYPAAEHINLKITGGSFTGKDVGAYAIYIDDAVDAKLAIDGGEFASAKDAKGKQLPALYIANNGKEFIEKHEGMITNGEFAGSIIGDVTDTSYDITGEDATAALALNAKTENGKVVVGNGANTPSDEGQQPGSTEPGETGDGNQGPTDNVKNPETNDNILVYAGLGLVSLATVTFTTRKRED